LLQKSKIDPRKRRMGSTRNLQRGIHTEVEKKKSYLIKKKRKINLKISKEGLERTSNMN
jgi:hypothetical protein